MSKRPLSERYRTISILSFFAVSLIIVGIVLRTRIGTLLDSYTEKQTEKQTEVCALLMAEKLETELENLVYIASKLEQSLDDMDDLMPRIYSDPGVKQGVLGINGEALYGEKLDFRVYEGIQSSFHGNKAITYKKDEGLLFTCPVFNGPNIRYVLYRLCPLGVLEDYFATDIYDDLGKICVTTRDGDIVIPFYNSNDEDLEWFESRSVQHQFASMHMEMEVSVAVAKIFSTDRGEMVLFESEIPGTDFLVSGFVPKSVASTGIGNITLLVVWVFGLLMLLVMIGAFYLSRVIIKARESDELREAKAVAEEASRAKGDFLANMSHEIRTPINTILGMNEMILREAENDTILTYAQNVKSAGTTLIGIINDILDFSKIEAGRIEIIPVDYDLAEVLWDLVNMVRSRADDKGLIVKLDFDSATPARLNGDEVRLKQIITNILTNAVKYTEKGSITFSVGYERLEDGDMLLNVSVADTGIGIRPEDMDKLFSKFDRIEEKRNRNIEGTGLGMSITKNLLDLMESELHVESVYGEGSVFSFSVKQKIAGDRELGDFEEILHSKRKHDRYHESFTAPTARVLVVDDNPMNIAVFGSLIKKTLIITDTAESGDEGLSLTNMNTYDLIFLDHMMPEKDGIETLHEMKAQEDNPNLKTPVICLTANAISGARQEYLDAGFDDYLTKPIDPVQLERMLLRLLPEDKIQISSGENISEEGPGTSGAIPDELGCLSDTHVDVEAGIKRNGTVDAYLMILRMFYGSIDEKHRELDSSCSSGDFKNYTIKVHALKSSARIIGADEFAEKAQKLEDAGKRGDTAFIKENNADFLKEYESFIKPLSRVFKENEEDTDRTVADQELMAKAFEELRAAADEMDCDRLEAVFKKMEKYRIPAEHVKLWGDLKKASDNYDYEEVLALL